LEHIGLTVDNLDAAAAELKSKGAHFTMEPVTFTPGTKIASKRRRECWWN